MRTLSTQALSSTACPTLLQDAHMDPRLHSTMSRVKGVTTRMHIAHDCVTPHSTCTLLRMRMELNYYALNSPSTFTTFVFDLIFHSPSLSHVTKQRYLPASFIVSGDNFIIFPVINSCSVPSDSSLSH